MLVRTTRLTLSGLTRADWSRVLEGEGTECAPDYPTEGDLVAAALVVAGDWPAGDWGPLQIRRIDDGMAIGGVGCKGRASDDGRVEIGYGLVPSTRGHGYATEAVLGLLEWLRDEGVRDVVAECDVDNVASRAVLTRCGFAESEGDGTSSWWGCRLSR